MVIGVTKIILIYIALAKESSVIAELIDHIQNIVNDSNQQFITIRCGSFNKIECEFPFQGVQNPTNLIYFMKKRKKM